jgi:prepilin-type processing-associated H-X9-DG protein
MRSTQPASVRRGITLVELLVVVAIVAALIALLLPAVQAVRESARMTQCRNNLRQIVKGFEAHEQSQGTYPSGGWNLLFVGDADRGFGTSQPGGWIYSLLPFVEQRQLWELPADGRPEWLGGQSAPQQVKALELVRTPLPLLHCPSRRTARLYPAPSWRAYANITWNSVNGLNFNEMAKTDYCASAGARGPLKGVGSAGFQRPSDGMHPEPMDGDARLYTSPTGIPNLIALPSSKQFTGDGVVFQRSAVRPAHVRDGLSYTVVVGEKGLSPSLYLTGAHDSDNEGAYSGDDRDQLCTCNGLPQTAARQDTDSPRPTSSQEYFGSSHSQGSNYAFGDGSVRTVSYDINVEMLRRMVVRNDQLPVEFEP